MKRNFLIAFAFAASAIPLRADYTATVLSDSPLAYFRFEEDDTATNVTDASGNGNDSPDLALKGSAELGVQGAIGKAVRFNGDGSIVTGLALDPSVGDFTLEAIIRPADFLGIDAVLISNRDGSGIGRSNLMVSTTGIIASFIGNGRTESGLVCEIDEWYHLILTYDQSAAGGGFDPTIRFYLNGVAGTPGTRVAESSIGPWVIGAHKLNNQQWLDGILDEVAIYGKRLDDPDGDGDMADSVVAAHYDAFLADTGIFNFKTTRLYLQSGESATLSWEVSPMMSALSIDNGVGDVLPLTSPNPGERSSGSIAVTPTITTTYTLSGTGNLDSDLAQVTIIVNAPPSIDSFTATPTTVATGGNSTLVWAVTNAENVSISGGIGPVDNRSGSLTLAVPLTTTFTLTATNPSGMVTAEATVTTLPGDPSLVAHWKVGEAPGERAGTTLVAEISPTLAGTFAGTGSLVWDSADPAPVPSGSTTSLAFDGNSFVNVLGFFGLGGASPRTVAFWVKADGQIQKNTNTTLVSWGPNTTSNRWDIRFTGRARGRVEVSGSGSDGTANIADGSWHHFAVTFEDDESPNIADVKFYVDGIADPLLAVGNTAVDTLTTQYVRIGASRSIATREMTGKLDDIRIYNRALAPDEILALAEGDDEPLVIRSIVRNPDQSATLTWNARPNTLYAIDYSLGLVDWFEIIDDVSDSSYTDITYAPDEKILFYRVREIP